MTTFHMLGSLLLGLAAWVLPFAAVKVKERFFFCSSASLGCCILSLLLQLLEVKNRVNLEDWSALMDTMHAVVLAAVVMVAVAAACNLFIFLRAVRH